jgi:hypothetical protein
VEKMELNGNEVFEVRAEAFRIMTGYMAPGKSVAAAAYAGEAHEKAKEAAWAEWNAKYSPCIDAMFLAFERAMP